MKTRGYRVEKCTNDYTFYEKVLKLSAT